jgi:UDP-GlcNAc3NAcA epimerase
MKILTIVGARPQFIKSAMFSKALKGVSEVIVHTGQHYDPEMSSIFFEELGMRKEDYNLGVNGGSHAYQTGQIMIKLEEILLKEKPSLVVLFGDTNSTLAGSLVASKLGVPVAHIEAGFRSFDRSMPEEINRVIVDHLSSYLFCPTQSSVDLLKKEGVVDNVYYVGDITYDAALYFSSVAESKKKDFIKDDYIFCTIHRASNTDSREKLKNIFDALDSYKGRVILPLHPRTRKKLVKYGLEYKNIEIINPVGYLESLLLCKNASKIVTDSGGVLREAYFFKKPCIILRDNVEFLEAVNNGEAVLVGSSFEKIIFELENFKGVGVFPNFFGDGHCAEKIVKILETK